MTHGRVTLIDAGYGAIAAVAPYSEFFLTLIRAVPNRRWNSISCRWEFPADNLPDFKVVFSGWSVLTFVNFEKELESGESPSDGDRYPNVPASLERLLVDTLRALKYSIRTRKRYLAIVDRFAAFIEKPLSQACTSDAIAFLSYLERELTASASTLNQAMSALRFFFLKVLGVEAPLPHRPRADRRLPGVLSREEAMRICSAPQNAKHRTILALAYSAGLRVSEIASLRVEDIDMERHVILVRGGKGRKDRFTILANRTLELVKQYLELYRPARWLFEGQSDGHITARTIQSIFYQAQTKAGIEKHASIHSLRHSFATHLLEDGTDIRYIQELLGHASAKTTEIYTHVARRDVLRIRSPFDYTEPDD